MNKLFRSIKTILSNYKWLMLAGIVLPVLLVYSPVFNNQYLNWDDEGYICDNSDVQELSCKNVYNWFSTSYMNTYLPFTIGSFAIDNKIDKLNPKVSTTHNLILHILNTLLIFWFILLIMKITSRDQPGPLSKSTSHYLIAFITAILFGLHPINVESVAWISERKNVLSFFFFLLSLIAYIKYVSNDKPGFYFLSLFIFICALFSKGTSTSLTLCIIATDYLFKRKIFSSKVILEKIPYLILSLTFGIVTIITTGSELIRTERPFLNQIAFASYAFFEYLYKLVVPANLSSFYSFPSEVSTIHWVCLVFIILATGIIVYFRKRISRIVIYMMLFYIANIIFLVQLFPLGNALISERYVYYSSAGFFFIIALGVFNVGSRSKGFYALFAVPVLLFGYLSYERVHIWNSNLIFWNDLIQKNQFAPHAWSNRGVAKKEQGDYAGALSDFNQAIRVMPKYKEAYYNRGLIRSELGDHAGALKDLSIAIKISPSYKEAYFLRGDIKMNKGDNKGAMEDYLKAIEISPSYKAAFLRIGEAKEKQGDYAGAIELFEKATKMLPDFQEAFCKLGELKRTQGDFSGALNDLNKAIEIMPDFKEAYNNRAIVQFSMGKTNEAYSDFNKALEIDSGYFDALYNRAKCKKMSGDIQGALNDLNLAIKHNSKNFNALMLRAKVKMKSGDYNGVITDCDSALLLNKGALNAIILKGAAYFNSGKVTEGIQEYSKAILLAPDSSDYYFQRGIMYFVVKDYKNSLKDMISVIKLKPGFGDSYYYRGKSKIALGDFNSGEKDLSISKKLGVSETLIDVND
jgi:protein O-mannosyl-transferase